MTIPEQAGKVAIGTIEALKNSPALLALIILQIVTMALAVYIIESNNRQRHERELILLKSCLSEIHEDD